MATINLTTSWQAVDQYTWLPGTGFSVTFFLDAKHSTQSQTNNNTTIQTRLRSVVNAGSGSGYNYSFTCSYAPTVSGNGLWNLGTETITSGGDTIPHNADGTKTVSLSATAVVSGIGMSVSLSGSAVLPKIARYPVLTSAQDFTDEGNPKITYTKDLGFSGATVQAGIFSSDGNTAYANYRTLTNAQITNGQYTFNLIETERTALRTASANSNSIEVMFKLRTTASGTNYNSTPITKTMTIVNADPTFTYTVSEANAKVSALLGSGASTIVENASILNFNISPTVYKNATVKRVLCGNKVDYMNRFSKYESPYTFNINVKSEPTFLIVVYDSRNNTAVNNNIQKTLINYQPVAIKSLDFKRQSPTSSNIILNLTATYYQQTFGGTANAPVVKWKLGSGAWNTISSSSWTINNTNHTLTITNLTLSNALVYTSPGTFTIYIEDKLTTAQDSRNVLKGIPTFEAGEHDLKVNGTLYVADTTGSNAKKVLTEWKSVGNKTGATAMNLPASFSELLCDVRLAGSNNYHIPIVVPYNVLTTTGRGFHQGYYYTASSNGSARINITTTTATLNTVYQNGSNILDSTTVYYFYR